MKKNLLIVAGLSGWLTISAQPVITSADLTPEFGEEFRMTSIEYVDVSGETGANMSWDYSDAEFTGEPEISSTIIDPVETDYADDFPDATFSYVAFGQYAYGEVNNSGFLQHGFAAEDVEEEGSVVLKYTDPKELFALPLQTNSSGSDNYAGEVIVSGQVFATMAGAGTWEVDGYGDLVTAYGTYSDVLRVKSTQVEEMTIPLGEFEITIVDTVIQYSYYSEGYAYALATFTETRTTDDEGQDITYEAVISGPMVTSGVENKNAAALSVFPNPFKDEVSVSNLSAEYAVGQITLHDVTGRLVKSVRFRNSSSNNLKVTTSELPEGIYILSAYDSDLKLRSTVKVVKN